MYLRNHSRKQKKRGMVCIAALMFALLVGGCGDKGEKADTTTALRGNETTTVSQEETGQSESEFDFSQVYDNIELNGKKIPFPFTLNDLGEEYDFKWDVVDMGDGLYGADLAHNGETIALIYMYGEGMESITRDSKIIGMDIFFNYKQEFIIKGINCSSNWLDISQKFIGIQEQKNKDDEIRGYRVENKGKIFDIDIDDNEIAIIRVKREEK